MISGITFKPYALKNKVLFLISNKIKKLINPNNKNAKRFDNQCYILKQDRFTYNKNVFIQLIFTTNQFRV
ncbi:hypothetical protein EG351_10155 [Chryseobacterium bernardetii]|nr:hypothetical protein EG351_10155 [Chryseobacterium bernardetii]